jgi:hypothetical protein
MALSRTETNIADGVAIGSLVTGTMAMGLAMLGNPSLQTNFAALGTSSFALGGAALGGAALGARVLYDQAGQKIVEWQAHRAMEKAIAATTADELDNVAKKLQSLEHALDHRIDVISDSKKPVAQSALGAWVVAAKTVLEKSQLFDVSSEIINPPAGELPIYWPYTAKSLTSRLNGYERMLDGARLQSMATPIIDDGHRP